MSPTPWDEPLSLFPLSFKPVVKEDLPIPMNPPPFRGAWTVFTEVINSNTPLSAAILSFSHLPKRAVCSVSDRLSLPPFPKALWFEVLEASIPHGEHRHTPFALLGANMLTPVSTRGPVHRLTYFFPALPNMSYSCGFKWRLRHFGYTRLCI